MFTLADGRMVTDTETGAEMVESLGGPITEAVNIESAKVARLLKPGAEFQFTFDLGDDWTHRCLIGGDKVDPLEVLGITPGKPLPYWGWGAIPDQYGRRWSDDDGQVLALDVSELRAAIATADAARFLTAMRGTWRRRRAATGRGRNTDGTEAATGAGRAGGGVGHQPADLARRRG
jgi:hypothetical protein